MTGEFPVTDEMIQQLKSIYNTPQGVLASQMWSLVYKRYQYYLWDGVTAVVALDENLACKEELRVTVVTSGPGQGRLQRSQDGNSCSIVTEVDAKKVLQCISALLHKELKCTCQN